MVMMMITGTIIMLIRVWMNLMTIAMMMIWCGGAGAGGGVGGDGAADDDNDIDAHYTYYGNKDKFNDKTDVHEG